MDAQKIFEKHLQQQIGRLVMELATANAVIEINQDAQKSLAEAKATSGSGTSDGAQSADGPKTES